MFDCTELETFLTVFPLSLLFVCSVTLITPNQFFTDGHVTNRDAVFSQLQDHRPLTSKPSHNPSALYICFENNPFRHKVKE